MGWGKLIRLTVWERQHHCCQLCGQFMTLKQMRCHHYRNKCMGGTELLSNAIGRHERCENLAHEIDKYGNPAIWYFMEVYLGSSSPRVSASEAPQHDVRHFPTGVRGRHKGVLLRAPKKGRKAGLRVRGHQRGRRHQRF